MQFATTQWSLVIAAGGAEGESARVALGTLASRYWYALYAFVRRQGYDPATSEDLTQGFFAMLLQRRDLAKADPARGRFRSFLLTALQHYLLNERERALAEKRGGGVATISIDRSEGEQRLASEPVWNDSPETLFNRRWALAMLQRVRQSLGREYAAEGKQKLFERLEPILVGDTPDVSYRDLAEQLGMSEGAIKVAVHRLRQRYGQMLRQEIADTVESPAEVDDEIRELFRALGGGS